MCGGEGEACPPVLWGGFFCLLSPRREGLFSPQPPPGRVGSRGCGAGGARCAPRCGGDASPAHGGAAAGHGGSAPGGAGFPGRGLLEGLPQALPSLPHSPLPCASRPSALRHPPSQGCPWCWLPRCKASPSPRGVPSPPAVSRSPHCPHRGTPLPPPCRTVPSLHEASCKVPRLRILPCELFL